MSEVHRQQNGAGIEQHFSSLTCRRGLPDRVHVLVSRKSYIQSYKDVFIVFYTPPFRDQITPKVVNGGNST